VDLSPDLARLRANLTPEEGERFRALGRLCAGAIRRAAEAVQPGQTEYEIAALLAGEAEQRGVQPVVNLIATDERVFTFRHPLPTGKRLERYAMLVLCGRRSGLVCSVTRLLHFGRLPDELRRKAEALALVDAAFISATRPGQTLGQVFQQATTAYADNGFPDEWRHHHQGGPAGYEPREYVATPDSPDLVQIGQAYAWNPSIAGTKSEDTILITGSGSEILTATPGWPQLAVAVGDAEFARPAILEVL
jgi:Xaa-Pro aminopeptidase